MSDPVFMSPEHVHVMNERLAASQELRAVASRLARGYEIAYRLQDDKRGRTEHWVMALDPEGVRFSLEPSDSADLTFVGDYWRMIDTTRASRAGDAQDPGLEVLGDEGVLQTVAEVFATAQKVGAVPVTWPSEDLT